MSRNDLRQMRRETRSEPRERVSARAARGHGFGSFALKQKHRRRRCCKSIIERCKAMIGRPSGDPPATLRRRAAGGNVLCQQHGEPDDGRRSCRLPVSHPALGDPRYGYDVRSTYLRLPRTPTPWRGVGGVVHLDGASPISISSGQNSYSIATVGDGH